MKERLLFHSNLLFYFPLIFAKTQVLQNANFALRIPNHASSVRSEASLEHFFDTLDRQWQPPAGFPMSKPTQAPYSILASPLGSPPDTLPAISDASIVVSGLGFDLAFESFRLYFSSGTSPRTDEA